MYSLKTIKNTAVASVLALGTVIGVSSEAHAAAAQGVASFDWSQFTITTTGTAAIIFGGQADTAVATAASNGVNPLVTFGPVVTPNWTDGVKAEAATGNAHYLGFSGAESPNTVAGTGTFGSGSGVFSDRAGWTVNVDSSVSRSLDFQVSGSGFVLFSVNYILQANADASGTSIANDKASAAARVSALLKNISSAAAPLSTSTAGISISFDNAAGNLGGITGDASTIGVALFFNAGDVGHLEFTAASKASTTSPAAVPLPPAGWLLGASLVMLARRRRV